ncbi:MAG: hypothetical protein ACYTFY_04995 [Planctomycetota bacterium]|jgi:hypothetical protein
MIDIDAVALDCHCTVMPPPEADELHIDQRILREVLSYFGRKYHDDVLLFGGQLATPLVYGLVKMRRHTNDIDYVVRDRALLNIVKNEHLNFIPEYGVFCRSFEGIYCVFMCNKIHKWTIVNRFYRESREWLLINNKIWVSSRDYLIAMKFKRGIELDGHMFAKDAIDIVNMLTAPFYLDEMPKVNWKSLCGKLKRTCGRKVFDLLPELKVELEQHMAMKYREGAYYQLYKFNEKLTEVIK